jgi:hypothetical protein
VSAVLVQDIPRFNESIAPEHDHKECNELLHGVVSVRGILTADVAVESVEWVGSERGAAAGARCSRWVEGRQMQSEAQSNLTVLIR